MAAGRAFLSSFVDAALNNSSLDDNSILARKAEEQDLLGRLKASLCAVKRVLDDAEQKQIQNREVKKWLVNLQDALYMADDLLDELSTKAAVATPTQKNPDILENSNEMVVRMRDVVVTLERVVKEKDVLSLKEVANEDMSWRNDETTSLLEGSDIYGRDKEKEEITAMLLDDTCQGPFLSFVDAALNKLSFLSSIFPSRNQDERKLRWRLRETLLAVRHVLDGVEHEQIKDPEVKGWLDDLQDALNMADRLLDELSSKAAVSNPTQTDPGNSSSWTHYVDDILEDSNAKMRDIVATLESLVNEKDEFHLDDTCVGKLSVISIEGMGGVGKTTLAQVVYNDARVKGKFDIRAWVCVATKFDPVKVTKAIIDEVDSSPFNKFSLNSLQTELQKKLTGKTFLVVLDDVWDNEKYLWVNFLKPFLYGNKGSKILLTTRTKNVDCVEVTNLHHTLDTLTHENCWSIFLKHSSLSTNSSQYKSLESIGRKIVEKCKGLPLAMKTLGGLLRNKYNERYWNKILESRIWELPKDESKIVPALRISYQYLSSYLKRCFVYCSLYPEDFQFDKDELILLWMAEGILEPEEGKTLEEIGCDYFNELVVRSFFQPSSSDDSLFVMHDLMHDLATFFAEKFYFRVKESDNPLKINIKTRHLSCVVNRVCPVSKLVEACSEVEHMRTFFFPVVQPTYSDKYFQMENNSCLSPLDLKYLRVLSFKCFPLESLPESIGELIHLRYLDLSYTPILRLCESLCNLYNLQTLKLKYCEHLEMLPEQMQDLVNLRYLDVDGASSLNEMPKGMSKLKNLNFLSNYLVGEHDENGIRELATLENLHGSFCISKLQNVKNSGEALEAKIGDKKHIDILVLAWDLNDGSDDVQTSRYT